MYRKKKDDGSPLKTPNYNQLSHASEKKERKKEDTEKLSLSAAPASRI